MFAKQAAYEAARGVRSLSSKRQKKQNPAPQVPSPPAQLSLSNGASSGHQNAALELAIRKHLDQLSDDEKDAFQNAAISLTEDGLLDQVRHLDTDHKAVSVFRHRAEQISKLFRFLDLFMGGITVSIQHSPEISSLIIGGIRLVLDIALRCVTYFTRLTDMILRLADHLEPLARHGKTGHPNIVEATAAAYGDLLRFCQKGRGVFSPLEDGARKSSVWTMIRAQWDPFEETFGSIESNFRHLSKSLLDKMTIRDQSEHTVLRAICYLLVESDQHITVEKKHNFLTWLSAPDFEKRHLDIYAKRHPKTGDWLLATQEFKTWFDSSGSSLLWRYVKRECLVPLASNVIEHISVKYALREETGISYVYYDYRDQKLTDLSLVISGIMKQLCQSLNRIPEWLLKQRNNCHTPSAACIVESCCKLSQSFDRIILVVDALDECPEEERHNIIDFLLTVA
ncbi:hypothetical protein AJ80_09528 [Polytolypa hystricis UAMH7299]|uniref:Nephrocystin 3-like N-terminal domain-containing protein n=1 Tax=Polytolypa hystricis (strain UAMH7299) TaxID=1447883 RepID=A0A2B7WPQ1_POLH7|nr:hypothetical protein AJ80_09528 [Polytolypa hystricis UAMH7299]